VRTRRAGTTGTSLPERDGAFMSDPRRLVLLAVVIGYVSACGDEPVAVVPPDADRCADRAIALQAGETEGPRPLGTGCLLPVPGAEYALAVLDPRRILSASGGEEEAFPPYRVTVTLGPDPSSSAGAVGSARLDHTPGMSCLADPPSVAPSNSPFNRTTPWVLGEEFVLFDPPHAARVVRTYGDGLVVAWVEGQRPEVVEEFLEQLDTAVPHVRALALPLLQEVFVPRLPVTNFGSDQYLIVLMSARTSISSSSWTSCRTAASPSPRCVTIPP